MDIQKLRAVTQTPEFRRTVEAIEQAAQRQPLFPLLVACYASRQAIAFLKAEKPTDPIPPTGAGVTEAVLPRSAKR